MPTTVKEFYDSKGIDLGEFIRAVTSNVLPEVLANEVYSKEDVLALLVQPGAMAIRPVNFNLVATNENMTLLVGVSENAANINIDKGGEYENMISHDHHLLAIPQTTH